MSRPTFNLGPFLEKEKLKTNGSNFMSWFRNLRILLTPHKMGYVLEAAIGNAPATTATDDEKRVYQSKADDSALVQSGMLYAMEANLQRSFETMSAFEIITDLKAVIEPQTKAERYEASEAFFSANMEEHGSVSEHVVKMSGHITRLNAPDCKIPDEMAIDRMVQSLPPSCNRFVMN